MVFVIDGVFAVLQLLELVVWLVCWFSEKAVGNPPPQTRRAKLKVKAQSKRARITAKRAHRRGRCVLCREDLDEETTPADVCPGCDVAVHVACAEELTTNGACPTYGCNGRLELGRTPERGRARGA